MKDTIFIKNCYQKLKQGKHTMFLDGKERQELESSLKKEKISYELFQLYPDCDKVIFYEEEIPDVVLLEIQSENPLEHRSILGSLFALGIDHHTFGDIIVGNSNYVVVLPQIADVVEYQLQVVGKEKVKIKRVDTSLLQNYERQYINLEVKTPSLRIDAVISKLLHLSRSQVEEKIQNKEVFLNYEIVKKGTKELKEQDIFSIRGYGKYRYQQIQRITKKQDMILEIQKYN